MWHLFVSRVEDAEYEHLTNCYVVDGEYADSMDIPKLVSKTRGDVQTWWILFMSEEQMRWLPYCELLSGDNNQYVPDFVACGRGLHLQGLYKGKLGHKLSLFLEFSITVVVKLLPSPRIFSEFSWTSPPVYENSLSRKIFLDRSNRRGGK